MIGREEGFTYIVDEVIKAGGESSNLGGELKSLPTVTRKRSSLE